MLNLIKLEFYKLRKQRSFKILLLAVIAISAFSAYSEIRLLTANGLLGSGKMGFANAIQDMFMLFMSAIFAGFYIGSDFSNKTIQSQLSQGHSRLEVLLSKALVFFIGTSMIMLLYPITVSIIHTFKYGWGEPFALASLLYVLQVAFFGVILNIGTTSVFVLIAFLCQDVPKTICFCLAFPVVISLLNSTLGGLPVIGNILRFTPLAQLTNIVGNDIMPTTVLTVFLSASITVVIMLSICNLLFAKAEIK